MKRMSYYIIGLLLSLMSWSCSDDAETGREEIPVETDEIGRASCRERV